MTASLAARHTWLIMYIVYMSRMIIVDLLLHDVDFFVLFSPRWEPEAGVRRWTPFEGFAELFELHAIKIGSRGAIRC